MMTGKNQGAVQPYAYGSLLQASTFGAAIASIYGRTQSPLLAIWTANLRQGGSTKKFKQMKKGVTAYCENIDFVLGHNPILGVLQVWNNGTKFPLNFVSTTSTLGSGGSVTIADAHFYAVIGVTITGSYAAGFTDYGANGSTLASGNFEIPLWNELFIGPDPTHGSAVRNYPYCYRWQPSYGATIYVDALSLAGTNITIHYAQLNSSIGYQTPLAKNRLHFEPVCGDGDEFSGTFQNSSTLLSTQQIFYPMFAGVGSASIDLGSGGVIPQLQVETQAKFGVTADGDADFVDMIEDILKSGIAQAFVGSSSTPQPTHTQVEHGLSCYSYPGCIQRKTVLSGAGQQPTIEYNLDTTAGNFLVVLASNELATSATLGISDTGGNTWTPIFSAGNCRQAWYATALGGPCTITISAFNNNGTQVSIFEVAGVDAFDSVVVGTAGAASLTTTSTKGFAGYLLGLGFWTAASAPTDPAIFPWRSVLDAQTSMYGGSSQYHLVLERTTKAPITANLALPNAPADMCLLAFKASNPASYPQPVGDFLDRPSFELTRAQCRANGLFGSLSMSSQKAASDWLKDLYLAANAAPVYVGSKLFSMPYSEVSAAGNGSIYTAPTASGPVFDLSTEKGDILATKGKPPITHKTASRVNQPNVLQMQYLARNAGYAPGTVAQPDAGSIAVYGLRKADAIQNYAIQDPTVARALLGVQARRLQYGAGDTFQFTLAQKWALLAPMGAGSAASVMAAPPLPRPLAPGESVVLVGAGTFDLPTVIGPFPPSIWTGGKVMTLTRVPGVSGGVAYSCGLSMTTGAPIFVPNEIQMHWSGYSLPASIDPSMVTSVYAVGAQIGDGTLSVTSPGGAAFGSEIGLGGLASLAFVADLHVTLEGADPSSGGFAVGAAVYYKGGSGTSPRFVPGYSSGAADAVITISDPLANINKIPVRITKITENADLTLDCEAEPYVYGMCAPQPLTTDTPTPNTNSTGASPGSVNSPVFIEVTPRLAADATQPQLWIPVSSPSANYGGCQPYVSTDGGASYAPIGDPLIGSAITGVSTADWPAAADPDTTNDLPLDLTESNGTLLSYAAAARDGFQYPCYIAGGGAYSIPYELFAYNQATLTAANKYTLKATGAGNELRRGIFAAPSPAVGVDHPAGSRFAFLEPGSQAIAKLNIDPAWIGKTLWFKFPAFNTFGAAQQSLSDATAYSYTITGAAGEIGPAGGFLVEGA